MITLAIQDAALAYAGAVQAAMRQAQAAYAANEACPTAQRDLRMAAQALERSDVVLADAYAMHKRAAGGGVRWFTTPAGAAAVALAD